MTERTALAVFRMGLHVHVDDAAHVHPFVMQHDVRAVVHDLERRAGRAPDTADRNRIAAKDRIVLKGIVGRDGFLSRRREELNHGLRTARTAIGDRSEQPRPKNILALRKG